MFSHWGRPLSFIPVSPRTDSMSDPKSSRKVALITGVTGQDGAYLSEYLLSLGYEVHGLKRRSSLFNTARVDHLYQDSHTPDRRFFLHYGDLTDSLGLARLIEEIAPDEIYNLAAQSHVKVSFELPEYTADVVAMGAIRMLEAIRISGRIAETRYYQASTSELYGLVQEMPQRETTPFYPRSPYACAKLFAYWATVNYREAYGLHASNGILFNHESPRRGETFVTRKITRLVSRIIYGLEKCLYLGNLSAQRDWGHAADYVRSMHMMLQQPIPDDYVVATGETHTVRSFAEKAFAYVGLQIEFEGEGLDEVGRLISITEERLLQVADPAALRRMKERLGDALVAVDACYFRPTEVEVLLGDATKAHAILGWQPSYSFGDIVSDMMSHDLQEMRRQAYLREGGFRIDNYFE